MKCKIAAGCAGVASYYATARASGMHRDRAMTLPWQHSTHSGLAILGKLVLVAYGVYKIYEASLLGWSPYDLVVGVALIGGGCYWIYHPFAVVRRMRERI